jgi:hypothetical protein
MTVLGPLMAMLHPIIAVNGALVGSDFLLCLEKTMSTFYIHLGTCRRDSLASVR